MRKQIVSYEVTCDRCGCHAGNGEDKISQYSLTQNLRSFRFDFCLACSINMDIAIKFLADNMGLIVQKVRIEGTEVME